MNPNPENPSSASEQEDRSFVELSEQGSKPKTTENQEAAQPMTEREATARLHAIHREIEAIEETIENLLLELPEALGYTKHTILRHPIKNDGHPKAAEIMRQISEQESQREKLQLEEKKIKANPSFAHLA